MLVLVNTNRMQPLVGPIGLDYVAGAARRAGIETAVVDLALAADPAAALREHFARQDARLVGISFRNADDCFWPSARWFAPDLAQMVRTVCGLTEAPIVLGGIGLSIFAAELLAYTGADFAVRGDGERAVPALLAELGGRRRLERVPGLVWREGGAVRRNPPAWGDAADVPTARDAVDNAAYFRLGGQGGVETKRGCPRRCLYCADPLAKGAASRLRPAADVADEFASLLGQGVDVLHLCDAEFNVPRDHALAVCEELARRSLGERVRWYAYLAATPFDAPLAAAMRRAGCVGINFTGDSASDAMLATYRQPHRRDDLAAAVRLCRQNGIAVMIDLLLGGPGETPDTVRETIVFVKRIGPDCAGAALGVRVYPGTGMAEAVLAEGPPEPNPNLRRRYEGAVDFFRPTFYIARALGDRPAELVSDFVGGDKRFFEPAPEVDAGAAPGDASVGYNYNDNAPLVEAIAAGARGAYWDILRRMRGA
jgi:radical SAM superfamily enzyme YgiQ (UPF0313 family)